MSVINQLLIDLEKRRASGAERGALPDHVRALPQVKDPARPWRIAGIVALCATSAAALAFSLTGLRAPERAGASTPPAVTAGVPAARESAAAPADLVWNSLSRMSLELSSVPAEPVASPAARVVAADAVVGAPARVAGAAPGPKAPLQAEPDPATAPARGAAAKPPVVLAQAPGEIEKNTRKPTPRDLAEADYARGTTQLQQGRPAEAREAFESALRQYPQHHAARQALFGLLMEARQHAEAERLLQDGLKLSPAQTGFAMALARMQVERGDGGAGVDTLMRSLEHARSSPDYLGLLAALLQRQQRHGEAVEQFQAALRLRPQNGVWLLGLGVSLQTLGRNADAQEAYQRAKQSGSLNPELQAFADQRLRQLQ